MGGKLRIICVYGCGKLGILFALILQGFVHDETEEEAQVNKGFRIIAQCGGWGGSGFLR